MAAPICDILSRVETDVVTLIAAPEDYLTVQKSNATKLKKNLKCLYDAYKSNTPLDTGPALHELIVKDFDEEQVWQQLELQNDNIVNKLLSDVAHLAASKQKPVFSSKDTYTASKVQQRIQKKKAPFDAGIEEEDDDEEIDDQDLPEDEGVNEGHHDVDEDEVSDDSLGEQEDEEGIDKNDKFFDFTGDSDDDLDFDFGPLGQKGDLTDDLFENRDSEDEEENNKHKEKTKKHKKSVTFKDDVKHLNDGSKSSKDSPYNEKLRSSQKGNSLEKELSELEAFLNQEDKKEEKRIRREQEGIADDSDEVEDENIDLFDDVDASEKELYYDDFFDQPDDTDEEDDEEEENTDDDDEEEEEDENTIPGTIDDEEEEEEEEEEADQALTSNDPSKEHGGVKGLQKKAKRDLLADSDSEGEDIGEVLGGRKEQKSSFEIRQEKLKKKIADMEKEIVAEKPWQLSGEVAATKRPENSLLQENLQFEYTTRLAPEITEETTKTLEDLIKQRVRDKAWDDVERKVKPKDNPFEYKKRITLDQEQSKLSLGEIYEQEYLKQQQADEEEKEDPDHESVKKMMQSLFLKLDALSNFHYTPKQSMAEVKIVSNQPSINMEEVAPVAVADSELLAPEEIQDKTNTELKGQTEKTKTDRSRERKKKKTNKRERQKEKDKRQKLVEKLNPGLGNKYSKERAMKKLEKDSKANNSGVTMIKGGEKEKVNRTSSKTFFTQLQEEVTTKINSSKADKRKRTDSLKPNVKKFKL